MMAGSVVTMLPVLLLFLALQRYYIARADGRKRQGMSVRARLVIAFASRIALACRLPRCATRPRVCSTISSDASAWTAGASDGVQRDAARATGRWPRTAVSSSICTAPPATRMRRALAARFSAELRDHVRRARRRAGQRFQFKLIDASGENVWWFNRANFAFPREWQHVDQEAPDRIRLGTDDGSHAASRDALEFVVVRGRRRRRRSRRIRPARIARTAAAAAWNRRRSLRTHRRARAAALRARAVDGRPCNGVAQRSCAGPEQSLTLDFGCSASSAASSCIGTTMHSRPATTSRFPTTQRNWRTCAASATARRRRSAVPAGIRSALRASCAARRRARHTRSAKSRSRISRSAHRPTRFSPRSRESAPRGRYPRGFSGEQPIGRSSASTAAAKQRLVVRGRRARSGAGGFSIEPFLVEAGDTVVTWADASIAQLAARRLSADAGRDVEREPVALAVSAFARGDPGASTARCAAMRSRIRQMRPRDADARARRAAISGQSCRRSSSIRPAASSPIRDIALE